MKPLLNKTTKPFIIYVLLILLISIPVYFLVVESIWINELDDHNQTLAQRTELAFNRANVSENELDTKIKFWNTLEASTFLAPLPAHKIIKDSVFTAAKNSEFLPANADDNYRVLITTIKIKNQAYYFRAYTSFEDSRETVMALALITLLFFILIVLGLLVLNNVLSKTLWKPFRNSLEQLKAFNLNQPSDIKLESTNIKEFEELNQSLSKLIGNVVLTYNSQKEFTENASHEMQTPLAILKNKLDLLLQSEDLTEKQYHLVEDMHRALLRSSRINKNLLLLAKIENSQFDASERTDFRELLLQCTENVQVHLDQKNIQLKLDMPVELEVTANQILTEILINNLLLNALRHTEPGGVIAVVLKKNLFEVQNHGVEKLNDALLFKRFSKLSKLSTLSTQHLGSGLGLSIVQEICRAQHWSVVYRFENNFHIFSVNF